jgi:hypothetical protein
MAAPALRTPPAHSEKSLGELLGDLSHGTAQLIRQEVLLARTEIAESLPSVRAGAMYGAMALVFGVCAMGAITAGIILVLSEYTLEGRTWLAALIVAAALGIGAALLAKSAQRAFAPSALHPDDTITSIKETAAWLKHPTKSDESSL